MFMLRPAKPKVPKKSTERKTFRTFASDFQNKNDMKHERFHHGYGHCMAEGCAIKDDCVHYLAYLEAKEMNLKNIETFKHCKDTELNYVRVRIEKG